MPSQNLSFRAEPILLDQVRQRDISGVKYPGAVAKRDVQRYYELLVEGLKEINLNPIETVILIYYVGTHSNPAYLEEDLRARSPLEEAFHEGLDSLADKVAGWSLVGLQAAWDAAERYAVLVQNREYSYQRNMTFGMALHRIGMHSYKFSAEELSLVESMPVVAPDLLPGAYLRAAGREGEVRP